MGNEGRESTRLLQNYIHDLNAIAYTEDGKPIYEFRYPRDTNIINPSDIRWFTIDSQLPVFTVAWDNILYSITEKVVPPDQLDGEIGRTQRYVSPKPNQNGDVGRATSEGPYFPTGTRIYTIKGIQQHEAVALEVENEYRRCEYFSELNPQCP